jgi:dTMP kinase
LGKTIIADRYLGSNLAHQTARLPAAQREEFISWLSHLEYGIYDLPREDLVLYLRMNAAVAHRLVGMKESREYTALRRDLHEADTSHLAQAAQVYDRLAQAPNWATIECTGDAASDTAATRPPDEIHTAVIAAIDERIPELRGTGKTAAKKGGS